MHEGLLRQVHPGHEVFHAAVYGPGFPAEVGLFESDHLRRKSDDQGVGHHPFHTLNTLNELITAAVFSIPLAHLCFPPAVHPRIEKKEFRIADCKPSAENNEACTYFQQRHLRL